MRVSKAQTAYMRWIIKQLNPLYEKDYTCLLEELFQIEFVPTQKYDDDRGADGIYWRRMWADEVWFGGSLDFGPPRMLEVLYGISFRIYDQIFGSKWVEEWDVKMIFWDMIKNLGLIEFDGRLDAKDAQNVSEICHEFCEKRHNSDIFTFFNSTIKIKRMPIWGRMHAYIAEKWPILG